MCRKEGMHSLCSNLLRKLGAPLPNRKSVDSSKDFSESLKTNDKVLLSTYQYWWSNGEKEKALSELSNFLKSCTLPDSQSGLGFSYSQKDATMFRVKGLLKRATWLRELEKGDVNEILETLLEARELAKDEYSVWHAWAVANYDQLRKAGSADRKVSFDTESSAVSYIPVLISPHTTTASKTPPSMQKTGFTSRFNYSTPKKLSSATGSASVLNLLSIQQTDKLTTYVVEAIKGFVRSIMYGQGQPLANLLQDTLRLLTLWFSYGSKKGALGILESELEKVSSENWLTVIPQLIARIHVKSPEISGLLKRLLVKVAAVHPQALVRYSFSCPFSYVIFIVIVICGF
jgi:FKBP12-rapamycin complex-associated protein